MDEKHWDIPADCCLFTGLDEAERRRLCRCIGARTTRYRRGETLWQQGDTVTRCGVVLHGRVRAESVWDSGQRRVLGSHGPGGVFGDVLMARGERQSPVAVVAAEDTLVLFLPYEGILHGCGENCAAHRRLRENLLEEISEKYWALRRRLDYLSRRSLRSRVAARLLEAAREAGTDTFTLPGSREELADELGVNRSALSRELGRMSREGLLEVYRSSFRLLDKAALEHSAR